VAGFAPPPGAQWQVLMPADGDEIIAHHDLAPWNLIMGDREWAFIDWDVAAPGTRLWDLAYAMHGFAPLSANPAHHRADAGRRLRLIADAYGLTEQQRLDVIPLLARLPGPCTTSSPSRPTAAPSPGHGSSAKATATPGRPTPYTSAGEKTSGSMPSSASGSPPARLNGNPAVPADGNPALLLAALRQAGPLGPVSVACPLWRDLVMAVGGCGLRCR